MVVVWCARSQEQVEKEARGKGRRGGGTVCPAVTCPLSSKMHVSLFSLDCFIVLLAIFTTHLFNPGCPRARESFCFNEMIKNVGIKKSFVFSSCRTQYLFLSNFYVTSNNCAVHFLRTTCLFCAPCRRNSKFMYVSNKDKTKRARK
jgi:hypothetical protein